MATLKILDFAINVNLKETIGQIGKLSLAVFQLVDAFSTITAPLRGQIGFLQSTAKLWFNNALQIKAFADQVKALTGGIVATTSEFETFHAMLTTALGSSSAAEAVMKRIEQFASETPFSVKELTESFARFANVGFKPTMDQMRNFGDLAAALGKPFAQLAEVLLDPFDIMRWRNMGIRAETVGNQLQLSFKGVIKRVDKTKDSVAKAIAEFGQMQNVAGGMERRMLTLGGSISNLQDAFDLMNVSIGRELRPLFQFFIEKMMEFTVNLKSSSSVLKPYITDLITLLKWLDRNRETVITVVKVYIVWRLTMISLWATIKSGFVLLLIKRAYLLLTTAATKGATLATTLWNAAMGTTTGQIYKSIAVTGFQTAAMEANTAATAANITATTTSGKVKQIWSTFMAFATGKTVANTVATDVNSIATGTNAVVTTRSSIATNLYTAAKTALSIATTGVTAAFRILWVVLAQNPLGVFITLLTAATAAWFAFSAAAERAIKRTADALNTYNDKVVPDWMKTIEELKAMVESGEIIVKPEIAELTKAKRELLEFGIAMTTNSDKVDEYGRKIEGAITEHVNLSVELDKLNKKFKSNILFDPKKDFTLSKNLQKLKEDVSNIKPPDPKVFDPMLLPAGSNIDAEIDRTKRFNDAAAEDFRKSLAPALNIIQMALEAQVKIEKLREIENDAAIIAKGAAKEKTNALSAEIETLGKYYEKLKDIGDQNKKNTDDLLRYRSIAIDLLQNENDLLDTRTDGLLERAHIEKIINDKKIQDLESRNKLEDDLINHEKEFFDASEKLNLDYLAAKEKMQKRLAELIKNQPTTEGKDVAENLKATELTRKALAALDEKYDMEKENNELASNYALKAINTNFDTQELVNLREHNQLLILEQKRYFKQVYDLSKTEEKKIFDLLDASDKATLERIDLFSKEGRGRWWKKDYAIADHDFQVRQREIKNEYNQTLKAAGENFRAQLDLLEKSRLAKLAINDASTQDELKRNEKGKVQKLAALGPNATPEQKLEVEEEYFIRSNEITANGYLNKQEIETNFQQQSIETTQQYETRKLQITKIAEEKNKANEIALQQARKAAFLLRLNAAIDAAKQIADGVLNVMQAASKAREAILDRDIAKEKERLDVIKSALKESGAVGRQYSAEQLAQQEERVKNLENLKRIEVEKQEKYTQIQVGLNMILAISQALASPDPTGGLLNLIKVGVIIAGFVTSIAVAREQARASIAQATGAKGGKIWQGQYGLQSGPSHGQGGIHGSMPNGQILEHEGGEWLFSKDNTKKFEPLFKAIQSGKMKSMQDLPTLRQRTDLVQPNININNDYSNLESKLDKNNYLLAKILNQQEKEKSTIVINNNKKTNKYDHQQK